MLAPKKQKYRKIFRGKNRGVASRGANLSFGEYGLKAVDRGLVTSAQIEAARKAIAHFTKREGKVWVRIFPDHPITAKGEGRMGAGKGEVKGFVAVVPPGKFLFELAGVTEDIARLALQRAAVKLPMKTRFFAREGA